MNVSGVSSAASPYDAGLPGELSKRYQDFAALHHALQSGSVTSAQSAFAAFQQDAQTTALKSGPNGLFAAGSQSSKDLAALGDALKSADLTAAQTAFGALAQDIQTAWQPANGDPIAVAPPHHHLAHSGGNHNAAQFTANSGAPGTAKTAGKILNLQA